MRYDSQHNFRAFRLYARKLRALHDHTTSLCKLYFPLKHQVDRELGIRSSAASLKPLLKKVRSDLLWWSQESGSPQDSGGECWFQAHKPPGPTFTGPQFRSPPRHVRTRLYFTSAEHLYSLFNLIGRRWTD